MNIEFDHITKMYGAQKALNRVNFSIYSGEIIGLLGPNGAGKSTIFRMIMDQQKPDSGSFKIGETVKIAYIDQSHEKMDPEKSIFEIVGDGAEHFELGGKTMNARAYLSRFNFSGGDQSKKIGVLSGGERNRLHLAKLLKQGANVLLLDEPTNDLDVETLRALEEALLTFPGCAIVISHDRWFLDRVATHILAFEGDAQVEWFEGSYTEFEEYRRKQLGDEALQPKRMKYKRIEV